MTGGTALPASSARELEAASREHQAGRLEAAVAGYEALLARHPAHAELRYRAGVALSALREFGRAEAHLAEAVRLSPGQPAAWLALGLARRERGDAEGALQALRSALAIDPATPQANGQAGLILQSLGRLAEAVAHLQEEARRHPQAARNHNNLGMALALAGRGREAKAAFVDAVRRDRDYLHAHANLAALFQREGDLAAAEAAWRQVLRLAPDDAPAHAHLGHLLTTGWRLAEALPVLRRAVNLAPESPGPARTLAYVLRRLNRPEEAREVARNILARRPDDLQAQVVSALALPVLYGSAQELEASREAYGKGLDALLARRGTFEADPAQVLSLAWENFHLAYQGGDDRALQQKYAGFVGHLGRLASPRHYAPRPARARPKGARVRVGFLSSFLRDCTVGKYFAAWATGLDRDRFEVFAYYTGHVRDGFVAGLAREVEHYRHILDTAPRVADAVLADGLDVLVHPQVGMDTADCLLAGMRLAPLQCAGWGHPVTTGQVAIDAYLSCDAMEPSDAQSHYTERLVRLPGIGTRYARPGPASGRPREALGLPAEGALYLCPQSLFKVHPDNDRLFASVLAADPAGRLVFFRDHDEPLTQAFQARLSGVLAGAGVDPARVAWLGRLDHGDYLQVNAACDVMLDTLHWSGGNTTLDALAAGLPVVTLPGRFMRGRQSAAILALAGVPELAVASEADYVALAVRLAAGGGWVSSVRERLKTGAARVFDDAAPIEALSAFLLAQVP